MGYASSARMGKLPFRLGPLQHPRQMSSILSSRRFSSSILIFVTELVALVVYVAWLAGAAL
jgi:hypothetical protein